LDSNVRYRGVPVGRVRDIIDPKNIERIRVTIEVSDDTPVKADTKATLEMQGLTGGIYVLLNEGTQTAADLPKTMKAPYPEIGSRRSALAQIFQGAPELIAKGSRCWTGRRCCSTTTIVLSRRSTMWIADRIDSQSGSGEAVDRGDIDRRRHRRHEPEFEGWPGLRAELREERPPVDADSQRRHGADRRQFGGDVGQSAADFAQGDIARDCGLCRWAAMASSN
jgi:hypothetical protein